MKDNERSVAAAVAELCSALPCASLRIEGVTARNAARRVLAVDATSRVDSPAFDNSAMDGYALRFADLAAQTPLREIGSVLAGHAFNGELATGACVRVMTGAPLPVGADIVVMREDAQVRDGQITVAAPLKHGANIRHRGEHFRSGEKLLGRGRLLKPSDIGLLAAAGIDRIDVQERLRIAVLSTGDELADAPTPLAYGASFDANRPLMAASLTALGFEVTDLGLCPDDATAFDRCFDRAVEAGAHVLLTSGGAAQGDADIVRKSGASFMPLNIRPGRGIAYARIERHGHPLVLLGLPGNAAAAFIVFHLVARPVLLHLARAEPKPLPQIPMPLATSVQHRAGRIDWMRAQFIHEKSGLCVQPLAQQGSAMLRTVTDADVLIAIGPQASYVAGDHVDTIALGAL